MYELVPGSYCEDKCGVVLDVGAHYGFYTLKMSKRARFVISLEPNPRNYMILKHNIEINKLNNVAALPLASGSSLHQAQLFLGEADGKSRVVEKFQNNTVRVLVVNLDKILSLYNINCVDIVKIDVEEYELEVLKGLENYLRRGLIKSIILEVHNKYLLREVTNLLMSIDYYNLTIYGLAPKDGLYLLYVVNRAQRCNRGGA